MSPGERAGRAWAASHRGAELTMKPIVDAWTASLDHRPRGGWDGEPAGAEAVAMAESFERFRAAFVAGVEALRREVG